MFRITKNITADNIQGNSFVGIPGNSVAQLFKTTTQTIPSNVETAITAYTSSYSSDTFFTVNASLGTISFTVSNGSTPISVLFVVSGSYDSDPSGSDRSLTIKRNSTVVISQSLYPAPVDTVLDISTVQLITVPGTYTYSLSTRTDSFSSGTFSKVNFSIVRLL